MRPCDSPRAGCWITPIAVAAPARPLWSANGSAAAPSGPVPRRAGRFRIARIRQSRPALPRVVQPGRDRSARAGACSVTRAAAPRCLLPGRVRRSASASAAPQWHQPRTRVHAEAQLRAERQPRPETPRRGVRLEIGEMRDGRRPRGRTCIRVWACTGASAGVVTPFVPKAAASRAGEGGRRSAVGPADPRVQLEHRQRTYDDLDARSIPARGPEGTSTTDWHGHGAA